VGCGRPGPVFGPVVEYFRVCGGGCYILTELLPLVLTNTTGMTLLEDGSWNISKVLYIDSNWWTHGVKNWTIFMYTYFSNKCLNWKNNLFLTVSHAHNHIHSLTHLFIHSFNYSSIHSLTHQHNHNSLSVDVRISPVALSLQRSVHYLHLPSISDTVAGSLLSLPSAG